MCQGVGSHVLLCDAQLSHGCFEPYRLGSRHMLRNVLEHALATESHKAVHSAKYVHTCTLFFSSHLLALIFYRSLWYEARYVHDAKAIVTRPLNTS